jgi:hypothetical protein
LNRVEPLGQEQQLFGIYYIFSQFRGDHTAAVAIVTNVIKRENPRRIQIICTRAIYQGEDKWDDKAYEEDESSEITVHLGHESNKLCGTCEENKRVSEIEVINALFFFLWYLWGYKLSINS